MQIKPKSEEEVKRLFDKGQYQFIVLSAEEKTSQSGNPMIVLDLEIFHDKIKGKTNKVKSFLMLDPNFEFLIRHFCYSVGLVSMYESGNIISSALVGKKGIASVGIEVDKSGTYPDKNRVLDFIVNENNVQDSHADKNKKDDLSDLLF